MPLLILLGLLILLIPIVIWTGALREHRRAAATDPIRGMVPLAVRLWAWDQVVGWIVGFVVLAVVVAFVVRGAVRGDFKPSPSCASVLREHPELAKEPRNVDEMKQQDKRDMKIPCIDDRNWDTTLGSYKLELSVTHRKIPSAPMSSNVKRSWAEDPTWPQSVTTPTLPSAAPYRSLVGKTD